ncbi:MAG: GTP cyclohydrolase I FolE [Rhodospirillaceae bacterium]|nr:GTP cyclohydrolase I FolE [Rhodospirillaceae bacterium]
MNENARRPLPGHPGLTTECPHPGARPPREAAEAAVRTLIAWAGDDPGREGLRDTPARVVRAYEELFAGYRQDPEEVLARTFSETDAYENLVVLKDIRIVSYCEHHMLPVIGKAHIAYLPDRRVVGISKLARVAGLFARRLQIQERLTVNIAEAIQRAVKPRGVGVMIQAEHSCMTMRGVNAPQSTMVSTHLTGELKTDAARRAEFMRCVGGPG